MYFNEQYVFITFCYLLDLHLEFLIKTKQFLFITSSYFLLCQQYHCIRLLW